MKKETNETGFNFKDFGFDFGKEEFSQEELGDLLATIFKDSEANLKKERDTKIIGLVAVTIFLLGIFLADGSTGGILRLFGFLLGVVWALRKFLSHGSLR